MTSSDDPELLALPDVISHAVCFSLLLLAAALVGHEQNGRAQARKRSVLELPQVQFLGGQGGLIALRSHWACHADTPCLGQCGTFGDRCLDAYMGRCLFWDQGDGCGILTLRGWCTLRQNEEHLWRVRLW